jgi:hypothetical protein
MNKIDENEKPITCKTCGYPPDQCRCEEQVFGNDCPNGSCS